MADAQDLKSWDLKKSCGFESRHRHQIEIAEVLQLKEIQRHRPMFVFFNPWRNLRFNMLLIFNDLFLLQF